ncbi:uncharacterized protein isoform X1 [Choristoneura fumiferana]|uniref:uncharacterized protein isoform X1 n=1 Tax=Choristoneura fumiferana TaxID=7141 RepID=UPI003D15698B
MGSITATALLLLLSGIGLSNGMEVNMTGNWKSNFGWELTCVWSLNSPLQSVRLYKDNVQFMIFRPEKQGPNITTTLTPSADEMAMSVECYDQILVGKCHIRLELLKPPKFEAKYQCEVSEEGPRFFIRRVQYVQEVYVQPSYPALEVTTSEGLNNVNCTAAGTPAPRLLWRIGEQRIPENFSNRVWDFGTKLWHSWSVVSVPVANEDLSLSCTAVTTRAGRTEEQTIEINLHSASNKLGGKAALLAIFALLTMLR